MLTLLFVAAGLAPASTQTSSAALPSGGTETASASVTGRALAKDGARRRRPSSRTHFDLGLDVQLLGGDRTAYSTRPGPIPFFQVNAEVEPNFGNRRWAIALPLAFTHRETPGRELRESRGRVGLYGGWSIPKRLWLSAELGIDGIFRLDWPDQYQPTTLGNLAPTDRYSSWSRRGGASARWRFAKGASLGLDYDYRLVVYRQDPNFDPFEAPTHLVPDDHQQHRASLEFAWDPRPFLLRVKLAGWRRDDFFNFSRDAGTGVTHAGPGGAPPNPLQAYQALAPSLTVGFRTSSGGLTFRYTTSIVEDPFQGYYSSVTHSPRLNVWWRPESSLKLSAALEVNRRRFGEGAFREGRSHPPLDQGTRRADDWLDLEAELAWKAGQGLELSALIEHRSRDTNFPDYVPGVYPRGREYDIAWDYEQTVASLVVRYRWGHFVDRP